MQRRCTTTLYKGSLRSHLDRVGVVLKKIFSKVSGVKHCELSLTAVSEIRL